MLNRRFKTIPLVSSLIGCEQGKVIVEKYDNLKKKNLMLLKCHYHLHPLVESSKGGGC
jgi:hypothetical protein